ncbi:MAG: hypothetical protein LBU58_08815 [Clostridiales bacterium]|jgi:hypothetical protein|nr:hypothetical protein [Clostridiales bacterium]
MPNATSEKICSNSHPCPCQNGACERHGHCCDCISFHKERSGLPFCVRALAAPAPAN